MFGEPRQDSAAEEAPGNLGLDPDPQSAFAVEMADIWAAGIMGCLEKNQTNKMQHYKFSSCFIIIFFIWLRLSPLFLVILGFPPVLLFHVF